MDLSKDNKDQRGKQTELYTLGSKSYAHMADSIANKKGRQIERGEMYEVAYSHRDGTAVNETAEANIAPFHVPETFSDEVLEKLSAPPLSNIFGGSPDGGAGTYVGDGSKQPSELELDVAFHQEIYNSTYGHVEKLAEQIKELNPRKE
nr:nad(p)h dehydrogenase (quinone) fqr1 [Quercus suber]